MSNGFRDPYGKNNDPYHDDDNDKTQYDPQNAPPDPGFGKPPQGPGQGFHSAPTDVDRTPGGFNDPTMYPRRGGGSPGFDQPTQVPRGMDNQGFGPFNPNNPNNTTQVDYRREAPREKHPMGFLIVIEPMEHYGYPYPVKNGFKIGTALDCQIQLVDDDFVSKDHATLFVREEKNEETDEVNKYFVIVDANSKNGTWVNQQDVRQTINLRVEENDIIEIGRYKFVLKTLL